MCSQELVLPSRIHETMDNNSCLQFLATDNSMSDTTCFYNAYLLPIASHSSMVRIVFRVNCLFYCSFNASVNAQGCNQFSLHLHPTLPTAPNSQITPPSDQPTALIFANSHWIRKRCSINIPFQLLPPNPNMTTHGQTSKTSALGRPSSLRPNFPPLSSWSY